MPPVSERVKNHLTFVFLFQSLLPFIYTEHSQNALIQLLHSIAFTAKHKWGVQTAVPDNVTFLIDVRGTDIPLNLQHITERLERAGSVALSLMKNKQIELVVGYSEKLASW